MTADSVGVAVAGAAAGADISQATAGGSTDAYLGSSVQVGQQSPIGGSVTVDAQLQDHVETDGLAVAAGIGAGAGNQVEATIDPTVTAGVGSDANVAANGSVTVLATMLSPYAHADSMGVAAGGITVGYSLSTATIAPTVQATVSSGAGLTADGTVSVLADEPGVRADAYTTSTAGGVGFTTYTSTTVAQTDNADLLVETGVSILGRDAVTLQSDIGSPSDTSLAIGNSTGFVGSTISTATNSVSTHSKVEVASDGNSADVVQIRTAQLNVAAKGVAPSLTTIDERDIKDIDTGYGTKNEQQPTTERLVDFNADVTILGESVRLHIGPQGQVLEQTSGVTFYPDPSTTAIDVNPIYGSSAQGFASLSALGAGIQTISGTASFHFDSALSSVQITNDSTANLVLSGIDVFNPNVQPNIQVNSLDTAGFNYTSDRTSSGGTLVKIANTGASDVLLTGIIKNPLGVTQITNSGGAILSDGSGQQINTGQLRLTAAGSIGTSTNRLQVQLLESATLAPVLNLTALGNAYLTLSALNLTANPLLVTGFSLAAAVIDLSILDSQQQTLVNGPVTAQASSYSLSGVSASKQLDVSAGVSMAVNLSFTALGDLPIDSIMSRLGDVSLTADGAIVATRAGGAADVVANNILLSAGTTIGAGNTLLIDSAHNASETVTATAGEAIALDQVAGNLALNQVKSTNGDIFLTAAGQILDRRSGGSAPPDNVEATDGRADLSAGTGIGTAANNLLTSVIELAATAGTGALFLTNVAAAGLLIGGAGPVVGLAGASVSLLVSGALTVNENVLSAGPVVLSAAALTVSDNTRVQSTNSAVTLTATGGVTLQAGSQVAANIATGQVRINSTGAADSTVNVSGVITAQMAQITTGPANDAINLYQLPTNVPLTVNGGGGSNLLYIPGTAGNDTFDITGATVTLVGVETVTYSNIQALTIDALAGNDTFNVTASLAALGTMLQGSGSDTLNLSANGSSNAPVLFSGGSGPNLVFVKGNVSGGDVLVAAPNQDVSGSSLPSAGSAPFAGDVIGAGLQLQYASNTTALSITLPGAGSNLTILGSQAVTTVQANAANQTVSVGGAPVGIVLFDGKTASFTAVQNMGGTTPTFHQSITVTGTAASEALVFDDSQGAVTQGLLNPTSVVGLGEDTTQASFQFTGISNLTIDLGNASSQQFIVNGTFADPTGNVTINTGPGDDNTVTVLTSTTPLVVTGGGGTGNQLVFDDSSGTSAINAMLGDVSGGTSLSGFGPIDAVSFSGFAEADLDEGSGSDTLSLNTSVATLAVKAYGNGGDDTFNVYHVGESMVLEGDSGQDTVNVIIPDAPSNHTDLLNLSFLVEHVIVDNTANPAAVSWEADNGDTLGYVQTVYHPILSLNGASDVQIKAGSSSANSLNVLADASPVTGAIDGNKITLVTGQNVLASASASSFTDFSNLTGIVHFASLTTGMTSYTEDGFTLSGFQSDGSPSGLVADSSITSAMAAQAPTNLFQLTAADNGLFSLYSLSLSGSGTILLTGTTANGKTVTQSLTVSATGGFETFPLPATFSGLEKVEWNPGSLLATNIVATETVAPSSNGFSIPTDTGFTNSSAMTININSDSGTINGVASGGTFNGTLFVVSSIDTGTVAQFYFYGNLNIPANSTVIGTGSHGISLYAANDVNVGSGVVFNMSATGTQPGPGGGGGGGSSVNGGSGGAAGAGGIFSKNHGTGGAGGGAFSGGASGGNGGVGKDGTAGSAGGMGSSGLAGSAGINSSSGGAGSGGAGGSVASFGATGGSGGAGIVWGDGTTTDADQITQPGGVGTPFHVFGTHTYGDAGEVATIQVTVKDVDGTVSNTTSSTLTVTPVPVVTGVVANAVDGTYGIGAAISITVTFDHPMTVDTSNGMPTLVLNSGGVATFSSVSSEALIFRYVVAAGDATAHLDYLGSDALKLNGGVIRLAPAGGGFNTDLTLPVPGSMGSISDNQVIVIVGQAPKVTGVTASGPNRSIGIGAAIDLSVTFDKTVVVNTAAGVPTLLLNSGGVATYVGGSNSKTLRFRYTVLAGQYSARLDYAPTNALQLNGGTIRQVGLTGGVNDADLALPVPGSVGSISKSQAILVDGRFPTVTSIQATAFNKLTGILTYQVFFSKEVTGVSAADFQIQTTSTLKGGRVMQLAGSGAVYTVQVYVGSGTGTIKLNLTDRDTIRDRVGNVLGGLGVGNGDYFGSAAFLVQTQPPRSTYR